MPDLYIFNRNEKTWQLFVSDGSANVNLPGSVWNSTTQHIVFSSSREPHDEIYLIKGFGQNGNELKITSRRHQVAYEPSCSPDGKWIVFESHPVDVEDNGIITKYNIHGSEPYITLTTETDDC